ncbi:MAG: ComEC/Rec2 family competence protein [Clostridia bacterium]|nr:ComEC/Rec2 family competence protein [Clostridia bacterium]
MVSKRRKLIHFRPLFYGFVAFLLALISARFVFSGNVVYIVMDCVIFFGVGAFLLVKKDIIPAIVLLSVFLLGFGWHFVGMSTFEGKEYSLPANVTARVSDDLYTSGNTGTVTLKDVKINGKKEKNIRLSYNIETDTLSVGDVISFNGNVKKAKMFLKGGSFNSTLYRKRTAYTVRLQESDIMVTGTKITFAEGIRLKVQTVLNKHMGEENGAVAYAVLFGDKRGIDNEMKNIYNSAGIVHILTVSGLHISFLIALLGFVLKKCKVKGWLNFLLNFILISFYCYLCGFTPSVCRAAIMGLVLLFANVSGKCYDRLNSLGFAGILILAISPLSALDLGFLMSFGSVFAIFVLQPQLSRLFSKIMPRKLADAFALTLSAQIGILPFVAQMFGSYNFLSVITNLVVIPVFSVLYPLLLISTLLTSIMPFMWFLLKVCSWGFDFIYQTARFMSVDALIVSVKPTAVYVSLLFFVMLFACSRYLMIKPKTRLIVLSILVVLISGLVAVNQLTVAEQATANVVDNSYNQTILFTNSGQKSVIIDVKDSVWRSLK